MSVILETPNVAVSLGPFGTVAGVQLLAAPQKPSGGLRFHVALPAKAVAAAASRNTSVGAPINEREIPRRDGDRLMEVFTDPIVR